MSGPWASCLPIRLYPEMDTEGDRCGQALATAEFLETCRPQGGPSRTSFLLGESLPRVWTGLPPSLTDAGSSEAQFLHLRKASPAPLITRPSASLYSHTHQPYTNGCMGIRAGGGEWPSRAWSTEPKTTTKQVSHQVPMWDSTEANGEGAEKRALDCESPV